MSNEVAIFSGIDNMPAVPEHLMDVLGNSSLFSLSRSTGFTSRRLSIRGNKFRMQVNGEEIAVHDGHIDVVILGSSENYLRQYYSRAYDPKDTSPPDCWSNDNKVPHANSAVPQASACAKCPQNIAGSGVGTAKACQTKANIAVVLANNIENGEVFELTVPAQSLFNKFDQNTKRGGLIGYSNYLDGRNVDPRRVVTRIAFDTDSSTPLLWFSGAAWVPSNMLQTVVQKSESEETKNALVFNYPKPSNDTPAASASAPAPTPTRGRSSKPAAPTAPTAPMRDATPAPVAEAPAPTNSAMDKAAALLDDWGDDV